MLTTIPNEPLFPVADNVEKLQSALAKGELRTVSVRKRDKEKRKTKEESDEIDSSEEL